MELFLVFYLIANGFLLYVIVLKLDELKHKLRKLEERDND